MSEEQKTILIVDDEETLTWSMSKNLSLNKSYTALCANSGDEAWKMLQTTDKIDLIISDIKMQGKDGLQLLSEVKAKYPKIGFIIMTAYGSSEKREEAFEKGAFRYLEKPFMMSQVKEVINEVLEEMERLFAPLNDKFKQSIKDNHTLHELILREQGRYPQLISLKLAALDGEPLVEAGHKRTQEQFRAESAAQALEKIDAASKTIGAGQVKEIIVSGEKYNIILRPLAENQLLLYSVFEAKMVMGKAMLTAKKLKDKINNLLDEEK